MPVQTRLVPAPPKVASRLIANLDWQFAPAAELLRRPCQKSNFFQPRWHYTANNAATPAEGANHSRDSVRVKSSDHGSHLFQRRPTRQRTSFRKMLASALCVYPAKLTESLSRSPTVVAATVQPKVLDGGKAPEGCGHNVVVFQKASLSTAASIGSYVLAALIVSLINDLLCGLGRATKGRGFCGGSYFFLRSC